MTAHELILYATPTGPFADVCDRFFRAARRLGPTVAQGYPPHCTLTGFFGRTPSRMVEVIDEIDALIARVGQPPEGAVERVPLSCRDGWLGLELRSDWLQSTTQTFVAEHRVHRGEEELRPKTWLHLSLAYGVEDLVPYEALAANLDFGVPAGWRLALWERRDDGTWIDHTSPPGDIRR